MIIRAGDFYMISRADNGAFLGSHKIFREEADGLHEVEYCGQPYWVRDKTVAWSQVEQDNSRSVRVEFNRGKGWRPLCNRPGDQVRLTDIGYDMEPSYVLGSSDSGLRRINRFSAIAESFRAMAGGNKAARSYHSN